MAPWADTEEGRQTLRRIRDSDAALTSLDLSFNRFGAEDATQLAECLRVNTALTSLDLGYNGIRDEGAAQLAEAFARHADKPGPDPEWHRHQR